MAPRLFCHMPMFSDEMCPLRRGESELGIEGRIEKHDVHDDVTEGLVKSK